MQRRITHVSGIMQVGVGTNPGRFQVPTGFRDSPLPVWQVGEVVASQFQIREELTRSETGQSFVAWDMLLDRAVGLKVAWRDVGLTALMPEVTWCLKVGSPAAVEIYAVGTHINLQYVVCERVNGSLLRERMIEGGLPTLALLIRMRDIAGAVAASHEAGIAVGEVSPDTLWLGDDGRIVVGRLSMSQVPAAGPMVACFDPHAAAAIDLYGLGCVAIELATGKPIFAGRDNHEILRAHARTSAPRLDVLRPELPIEFVELIDELLNKDPNARPTIASAVHAQLAVLVERAQAEQVGPRVLIVDDDERRARTTASLIRRNDARATIMFATSGADIAARLHRAEPDLVIVELLLGGEANAFDVCAQAQEMESMRAPRVSITASEITDQQRERLAPLGVRDFVLRGPHAAAQMGSLMRFIAQHSAVIGLR